MSLGPWKITMSKADCDEPNVGGGRDEGGDWRKARYEGHKLHPSAVQVLWSPECMGVHMVIVALLGCFDFLLI